MITLHHEEQGSPEWHELRRAMYTGSAADKLLSGGDAFKILSGVVSSYALNEMSTFSGNFHTKRGHLLEDEAIVLYERINKTVVPRVGFVTNDKYPNCGYSPDGYPEYHNIEVKCFNEKKHLEILNGKIPLKILAQIHFGLLICEKKWCDLVIYNPNFAKKELLVAGVLVPNKNYDPKKAFKVIKIKYNRDIATNFKRILKGWHDGMRVLRV